MIEKVYQVKRSVWIERSGWGEPQVLLTTFTKSLAQDYLDDEIKKMKLDTWVRIEEFEVDDNAARKTHEGL